LSEYSVDTKPPIRYASVNLRLNSHATNQTAFFNSVMKSKDTSAGMFGLFGFERPPLFNCCIEKIQVMESAKFIRFLEKYEILLVAAMLGMGAVFVGFGIGRSPLTWVDEVFYAEPARQLYLNGVLASPIFFDLRNLDQNFFLHPPLYFVVQSLWFHIFGFSQHAVRVPSVIYYLASILLVYGIMKNVLRSRPDWRIWALLASIFFACDKAIIHEIRSGRSGGLAILLVLASVYVLNRNNVSIYRAVFFSTILGCAALLTHLLAGFLMAGYVLNILFNKEFNNIRLKIGTVFLAAVLICITPYIVYVAPNYAIWKNQLPAHCVGARAMTGILEIAAAIFNNFILEFKYEPFFIMIALISIYSSIFLLKKIASKPILFSLCGFGIILFITSQSFYKFIMPLVYINIFVILAYTRERISNNHIARNCFNGIIILGAVNILTLPALQTSLIYSQWKQSDPSEIERLIRTYVPDNSKILSVPISYYTCNKANISFRYPLPFQGVMIGPNQEDVNRFQKAVRSYNPEFLILKNRMDPNVYFAFLEDAHFISLFQYTVDLRSWVDPYSGTVNFTIWKIEYR
jgi:hypothetical protein